MKITHEKSNTSIFIYGQEHNDIKKNLTLKQLLKLYNIKVEESSDNMITICKTTNDFNIINFTTNNDNGFQTLIHDFDLIDDNDNNIQKTLKLKDTEILIIKFNSDSAQKIVIKKEK